MLADRFARWKSVVRESTLAVANPRGSESMEASAAAPIADLVAAVASVAPPPETVEVNFHTDVKFPARLQRNKVEWLIVRLRLEKPAETVAAGLVAVEFTKQGDEPPPPEYLTVRVLASDFDEETRVWERTITVHHDRDSDPAVFLLKAAELGKKRITIDFEHKGRPVGSVWFVTEVVDDGDLQRRRDHRAQRGRCAGVCPLRAQPAAAGRRAVARGQEERREHAGLLAQLGASRPALQLGTRRRGRADQPGSDGLPGQTAGTARRHGIAPEQRPLGRRADERSGGTQHPGRRALRAVAARAVSASSTSRASSRSSRPAKSSRCSSPATSRGFRGNCSSPTTTASARARSTWPRISGRSTSSLRAGWPAAARCRASPCRMRRSCCPTWGCRPLPRSRPTSTRWRRSV